MSELTSKKKTHFVAFVDILGFKELVLQSKRDKLNQCFAVCEALIKYWKETDGKSDFKVYNFSDSIVVLVPVEKGREKILFKQLCVALAELQYQLAKNDVWVRGGVSCGEMEISESSVNDQQKFIRMFGVPLIQAYEIESKIAKYPRIVIDPSLIEFLKFETALDLCEKINEGINYSNWKGDVLFNWPNKPNWISHDVSLFIDYLEYLFHDFGNFGEENKIEEFVEVIRTNINKEPKYYEKYRWVADYLITKFESKYGLETNKFMHYTTKLHKI